MKKVLIIIPCYNESDSIIATVNSVIDEGYDYVVINDGSTDNSLEIMKINKINFINLDNNLGIGAAIQTGYRYANRMGYDIAVQFDGDGQHDARFIEDIIEPIVNDDIDLTIGSRFTSDLSEFKSSLMRRCGILILGFLQRSASGIQIRDMTSGFRAVNKRVIQLFDLDYPHEYPEPVTNLKCSLLNLKIKEIPVKMNKREFGASSITPFKSVYYMFNVVFCFLIIILKGRK